MGNTDVVVVTHERSGTHLTIDILRNNFGFFDPYYISMKEIALRRCETAYDDLTSMPKIIKAHFYGDPIRFYGLDNKFEHVYQHLLNGSKYIYVYRDGRDVITSRFKHMLDFGLLPSGTSFSDFLYSPYGGHKTPMSYWRAHVKYWFSCPSVLLLSYESIMYNYIETVVKIAQFLGCRPAENIVDVRAMSYREYKQKASMLTTVGYSDYEKHKWLGHFSSEDTAASVGYSAGAREKLGYDCAAE